MPTIFENSNLYKVIILSTEEIIKWHRAAACDHCGSHDLGYWDCGNELTTNPRFEIISWLEIHE